MLIGLIGRFARTLIHMLPEVRGKYWLINRLCCHLVRDWPAHYRLVLRDGITFDLDLREVGDRQLFLYGVYEPDVSYMLRKVLRRGDVFVDVGANKGFHTVLAARLCGPEGHVYSFEPLPHAYNLLQHHIQLNRLCNVTPNQMALGDVHTRKSLYVFKHLTIGQSSLLKLSGEEINTEFDCEVMTLDQYIHDNSIVSVNVLKIDVEGFELPVLLGAHHTLIGMQPVVIFEVNFETIKAAGYQPKDVFGWLSANGYTDFYVKKGRYFIKTNENKVRHWDNVLALDKDKHSYLYGVLPI